MIQKGLTYLPNAGGSSGRGSDNAGSVSNSGSSSDEDDVPTSSVRGRPNIPSSTRGSVSGPSSRVPASSGSPTGSSLSGSGRPPSPYAREIAAGRDPSIVTRYILFCIFKYYKILIKINLLETQQHLMESMTFWVRNNLVL